MFFGKWKRQIIQFELLISQICIWLKYNNLTLQFVDIYNLFNFSKRQTTYLIHLVLKTLFNCHDK